jgi:hypothetical protein
MDQHVWISDFLSQSDLVVMFNSDIAENNVEGAIEGLRLLTSGSPVPRDLCPRQVWNEKGRKEPKRLAHLSMINGYPVISEAAAAVIGRFDLGDGALYPIDGAFQSDRTTTLDGKYFCWVFGNQKQAFQPEESPDRRPFGVKVDGEYVRWNLPFVPNDDGLAVSVTALQGPDVWVDPLLFKSVFLSSRLADALDQAGLSKTFRLFRCRVV